MRKQHPVLVLSPVLSTGGLSLLSPAFTLFMGPINTENVK